MKKVEIHKVYRILKEFVERYEVPTVNKLGSEKKEVFRVLVAGILSARSKDEVTNEVSEKLFSRVKNFKELKKKSLEEIRDLIKPIRFYNNKARYLEQLGKVMKGYEDKVPDEIEELMKLPGVGRKTANLVLVAGFGKPALAVDVHVHRIMNRLGYVKTRNNYETEMELRRKLPRRYWLEWNKIFVAFGQNHCRPISPWCSKCPVVEYCNRIGIEKNR